MFILGYVGPSSCRGYYSCAFAGKFHVNQFNVQLLFILIASERDEIAIHR